MNIRDIMTHGSVMVVVFTLTTILLDFVLDRTISIDDIDMGFIFGTIATTFSLVWQQSRKD